MSMGGVCKKESQICTNCSKKRCHLVSRKLSEQLTYQYRVRVRGSLLATEMVNQTAVDTLCDSEMPKALRSMRQSNKLRVL